MAIGPTAPRIGARLLAVGVLGALVAGGGSLVTRAGVRPASEGRGPVPRTGAWYCPHGGGPGWKGWVSVANPGRSAVTVRITTFGPSGAPSVQTLSVGGSAEATREVPVTQPGAATSVEYFGGWVAAATVVRSAGARADVAAERCVGGLRRGWTLPDETTAPGEDAQVVLLNPYAAPAEFDVVIRTNERSVRPGAITPAVLAPRSSMAIHLDRWALEAPGEDTVTAQIVPRLGRVVAGSVVVSAAGTRAEAGVPLTSRRWLVPAAGYAGSSRLAVANPGNRPASIGVVAENAHGRASVSGLAGSSVEPGGAATFELNALSGSSADVTARGGGAIAESLRLTGPAGGEASVVGALRPAKRWLVLPTAPADDAAAKSVLVLLNPGPATASVTVRLLGARGDGSTGAGFPAHRLSVPSGRTITFALPGGAPVAAFVLATTGGIVAGGESTSHGGSSYAATSGIPVV